MPPDFDIVAAAKLHDVAATLVAVVDVATEALPLTAADRSYVRRQQISPFVGMWSIMSRLDVASNEAACELFERGVGP